MGVVINYEKFMSEIVFINLLGPSELKPSMTGGELLHGFLADLNGATSPEVKNFVIALCLKLNVHYRRTS
jgi:hypothetical protein